QFSKIKMYCFAFTVFVCLGLSINAFNLSPNPSLVINSPKHQLEQTRSSYFGYTLVIRPTSIIVGAPRAQSTLEPQKNITETGAIYKCSLEKGDCMPYFIDDQEYVVSKANDYYVGKDFQWLGGSMDSGTLDTDMLVVCAPRSYLKRASYRYMTGVCYRVQNTTGINPGPFTRIFGDRGEQMSDTIFVRAMGFSAHVVEDKGTFLIGAPYKYRSTGSISVHQSDTTPEGFIKEIQDDDIQDEEVLYFGYAVSSGYFDSSNTQNLLYVISAPRANFSSGVVYIYSQTGSVLETFYGDHAGEYFGYSVLAEDLNGDNLTDLIVSAPMHGSKHSADNGIIYVFINKGLLKFERKTVKSPLAQGQSRFGTTLSRLGDINLDGYNDVAVGAPFAGNGSVFIYLGSEHGLRDVPSQQLDAPSEQLSEYGAHMFGHGLSRGSDIDGNGFNDLAIGAPNAEAVYLYQTYPVIKVHSTVKSDKHQIKPKLQNLNITACYRLSTPSKKKDLQKQVLAIQIVADPQLQRATFALTQKNTIDYKVDVGHEEKCRVLELQVSFAYRDVYKPIDVQMHFDVVNNFFFAQESKGKQKFCETCVAVDPTEPKISTERIMINVECANEACIADLQLNSPNEGITFTLGSNGILLLMYQITNDGETAYRPQFSVTSDSRLPFAQVPGDCLVSEAVMMCNLNSGQALGNGETDSITVSFDVSQLSGTSLKVTAEVFSSGDEKNVKDNKHVNKIGLEENTEIDVMGEQASLQIYLDDNNKYDEVINHFEIMSHGPSVIEHLAVALQIPIAYKPVESTAMIPIINVTSLQVLATYDSRPLVIQLFDQDKNQLIEGTEKASVNQKQTELEDTNSETKGIRSRRDIEIPTSTSYNLLSEKLRAKLPMNRTIVISCQDSEKTICVRVSVQGVRLRPGNSVYLNVSYHMNLGEVNSILMDPFKYFVILTDVELAKENDPTSNSLDIKTRIEPNIISKHLGEMFSIWYVLPAVLVGLLIFAVIIYTMNK
ncbi:hypothetical protein KR032_012257, partial [Drosophila birchii]